METIANIFMLLGLVLMITALIILYRRAKGKTRRSKIEELAESFAAAKYEFDQSSHRFNNLLDSMEADNKKFSILKGQIYRLEDSVNTLENKKDGLEINIASLTGAEAELRKNTESLVENSSRLHDDIARDKRYLHEIERYIGSLQKIKEGLEIAVNNIPVEEVHYLSRPIFNLGITSSACNRLTEHGILYIGDLIRLDEHYLIDIWGIGPATVEKIKTKMDENGVRFGMDVIRVENHWYRRKTD